VQITAIRTSCGCTSAAPEYRWIKPEGSDDIAIRVDSLAESGPFYVTVMIATTSKTHPVTWIKLTGDFVTPRKNLVAFPSRDNLRYTRPGAAEVQVFRLQRNEQANLGPLKVTTSVPWITVKEEGKRRRADKLRYYLVSVTPPAGIVTAREEILFQGSERNDFVRVPIFINVQPVVGVWPNKVLLVPGQTLYRLMVRPALSKTATLLSYSAKAAGIRIVSVRQSKKLMDGKPALDVKAEPVGKGFISAALTLHFKQWKEPVKVTFVGVGQ
jgi:hypothetical protein